MDTFSKVVDYEKKNNKLMMNKYGSNPNQNNNQIPNNGNNLNRSDSNQNNINNNDNNINNNNNVNQNNKGKDDFYDVDTFSKVENKNIINKKI